MPNDTQMVDWMERHSDVMLEMEYKGIWSVSWWFNGMQFRSDEKGSLREAITSAMRWGGNQTGVAAELEADDD